MDPNLARARDELDAAADGASRVVETQLHSIREGLSEEEAGDKTQAEPGPKPDRIAELLEKLQGLEAEAEGETATHIAEAEAKLRDHMHEHPHGG